MDSTPCDMDLFKKPTTHLTLIILIGLLVYSNTFTAPFHFDDHLYISQNPDIKDLSRLWPPVGIRCFGTLTFALNYRLGGLDVIGYHALNLAIHILAAIFVYALVVVTFRTPFLEGSMSERNQRLIALFAALLFVSHPIQTQAVTYISQRFTSLATMLYLLSLVTYVRFRLSTARMKQYGFYGFSILSAVLAMKTKEITFTLPFLIVLYEFSFLNSQARSSGPACEAESNRRRVLYLVPFLLILFIIPLSLFGPDLGLYQSRESVDEQTRQLKLQEATSLPRYEYLITQLRVIVTYVRLLFFPIDQNLDYDYPLYASFFNPAVFLSFLFILFLLGLAVYLFRKSGDGHPLFRLPAFGIIWFFLTLSVESSVIPIKDVIFEHRVYLPSVGVAIAFLTAVSCIAEFTDRRLQSSIAQKWFSLLTIITVTLSIAAYQRNMVWRSDASLWLDAVLKSPNKARSNYEAGLALAAAGDEDKGYYYLSKARQLDRHFFEKSGASVAEKNYALGLIDDAIKEYQKMLMNDPLQANIHDNLGNLYQEKGFLIEAVKEYQKAISIDPANSITHCNLGVAYFRMKLIKDAVREFHEAIKLDPQDPEPHAMLGRAYAEIGMHDAAVKELQNALTIDPSHEYAKQGLVQLLQLK